MTRSDRRAAAERHLDGSTYRAKTDGVVEQVLKHGLDQRRSADHDAVRFDGDGEAQPGGIMGLAVFGDDIGDQRRQNDPLACRIDGIGQGLVERPGRRYQFVEPFEGTVDQFERTRSARIVADPPAQGLQALGDDAERRLEGVRGLLGGEAQGFGRRAQRLDKMVGRCRPVRECGSTP